MPRTMPVEFILIVTVFICTMVAGLAVAWLKYRNRTAHRATPGALTVSARPATAEADTITAGVSAARPVLDVVALAPGERQHTILAAKPGDGKTTTMNTMLVADIARGCEVIVCNPHFTYFHPDDQRIDLRTLRERFTVVFDYADIAATLRHVLHVVKNVRLPLYREGLPVGHHVVVYLDEWPAIAGDATYGKECAALFTDIVRQARKCNIWLVFASQDALVGTLRLSGGIRANFATRLVGNVDATTWRELLGSDVKRQRVERGAWYASSGMWEGIVTTTPPTPRAVRDLAGHPAPRFVPIFSDVTQPVTSDEAPRTPAEDEEELQRVWQWSQEGVSGREMARRLYRLRGGTAAYDGSGDLFYEATTLVEEARKRYGVMVLSGAE